MRKGLVVCLIALGLSTPALAEDWQPVPGDSSAFFDSQYLKVDEQSGLVLMRYAIGRATGPYASWPKGKSPIMVYALDCANDAYKDVGLDFEGEGVLPKGWREEPTQESIGLGVGPAGKTACERADTLPKVALP